MRRRVDLSTSDMQKIAQEDEIDNGHKENKARGVGFDGPWMIGMMDQGRYIATSLVTWHGM